MVGQPSTLSLECLGALSMSFNAGETLARIVRCTRNSCSSARRTTLPSSNHRSSDRSGTRATSIRDTSEENEEFFGRFAEDIMTWASGYLQ